MTPSITVGAGRRNPKGSRVELVPPGSDESLAIALATRLACLPPAIDGWWSGHLFEGDHRAEANWRGAWAIAVDCDYHDAPTERRADGGQDDHHARLPVAVRERFEEAATTGRMPGSVCHVTPRGVRIVFALDTIVTDGPLCRRAIAGACESVRRGLAEAGLLRDGETGTGLEPDGKATDLARMMFTPAAIVDGVERSSRVTPMRVEAYRVHHLAGDAPDGGGSPDPASWLDEPAPEPEPDPAAPQKLLDDDWRSLREAIPEAFTRAPPRPSYLLLNPSDLRTGDPGAGLLRMGKVGMLSAAGGVGKTQALVQLALSVSTGRPWLDHFEVGRPGQVLLVLAEEDAEETHRRLYFAAAAMRLSGVAQISEEDLELALDRITVLPMAGRDVALMRSLDDSKNKEGELPETPFAIELRERLATTGPWSLIVLDPLSRFAGPDTEVDNSAATRFVQVLEHLTQVDGGPALLFAHHTSKNARRMGTKDDTAARGATGLSDAARWHAVLEALPHPKNPQACLPRMAEFTVVKSNLAAFPEPLILARGPQGELAPATESQVKARQKIIDEEAEFAKLQTADNRKEAKAKFEARREPNGGEDYRE